MGLLDDVELTESLLNILRKKENEESREIDHAYLLSLGYSLTSDHWDKLGRFYVGYYGDGDSNGVTRCVRYHKPTGVYTSAYKKIDGSGPNSWVGCEIGGSPDYKLFKRKHIIKQILNQ